MSGPLCGVIALDGPSGTGKTTVARALADRLDARYLDTGAMYRAATLAVLRTEVDPTNAAAVTSIVRGIDVGVGTEPTRPWVTLDGEDIGVEARGAAVNRAVSAVSAVPEVRTALVAQQRKIITEVLDAVGGMVVEGRDIGTVVAVDAPLKVYLTASAEVRASRRSAQDPTDGHRSDPAVARRSVDRRDRLDSTRAASPLRAAPDAVELDTSDLRVEQVVVALCELASQRGMLNGATAEAAP